MKPRFAGDIGWPMDESLKDFVGERLTIKVQIMRMPSGAVVTDMRPFGMMQASERETIAEAVAYATDIEGRFMVLDMTDTVAIDAYGAGEILLLSGQLLETARHFSLVVRDGVVGNYLRKYGIVDIVKSRRTGDGLLPGARGQAQGVMTFAGAARVAAQSW